MTHHDCELFEHFLHDAAILIGKLRVLFLRVLHDIVGQVEEGQFPVCRGDLAELAVPRLDDGRAVFPVVDEPQRQLLYALRRRVELTQLALKRALRETGCGRGHVDPPVLEDVAVAVGEKAKNKIKAIKTQEFKTTTRIA